MSDKYDWSFFYRALCARGPQLLGGIDEGLRSTIADIAATSDEFWSDGLEDLLAMSAVEGDYRQGVIDALGQWRNNVAVALDEFPFTEIDCGNMRLELDTPEAEAIIEELVEAARPGPSSPPRGETLL